MVAKAPKNAPRVRYGYAGFFSRISFRDALHKLAVAGWLFVATIPAQAQGEGGGTGSQPSTSQAEQQPKPDQSLLALEVIKNEIERIARAIEAQKDEADAKSKNQREESDLNAQWEMARWAENMFWAAIGSLILTAVGVLLIWRTLIHTRDAAVAARDMVTEGERATRAAVEATKEARRQADISEESFRRLERPYLFIQFTSTGGLREPGAGSEPYLKYNLVNRGKTPAIMRSISITLQDNPTNPLDTTKGTLEKRYAVIEPGGKLPKERKAIVSGTEKGQKFLGDDAPGLILYGVIEYEDPTGAYHIDRFFMRGLTGGGAFEIEGAEHNRRDTHYPKAKNA